MSEIKAVLLVPEPGDPHGLLAEGPCGARPPIAYIPNRGWRWTEGPCAEEYPNGRALVLAWGGEPVAEGLDRATAGGSMADPPWWVDHPALADRRWHTHEIVEWVGPTLADLCSCTLVLLDGEGREVSDD